MTIKDVEMRRQRAKGKISMPHPGWNSLSPTGTVEEPGLHALLQKDIMQIKPTVIQ